MKSKPNRRRRMRKQKPSQKKMQNEQFFETNIQRKCEKCEDEEKQGVQKKSDGKKSGSTTFFGHFMKNIQGKGTAMPQGQRTFFEGKMGDNFGNVQIHRDQEATNAAKEIGAKAFTWENHVVLNSSSVRPYSQEEKQVLAHELKHVQQQRNGRGGIQRMPEETETDQSAAAVPDSLGKSEGKAMEKEAELEEAKVLVPEPVPDIQYIGRPSEKLVFGNSISLEAVTNARYDGGVGSTAQLQRSPVSEGPGCAEGDCWHYTGSYVIQYHVTTSVTLPTVPPGLTDCQQERVRNAISNELAPHEQEHVAAFGQYNGSTTLNIDYTGPSAGIEAYVQQLHDADELARRNAANAASAALDPFHVSVDLECEEPPATAPDPEPEE